MLIFQNFATFYELGGLENGNKPYRQDDAIKKFELLITEVNTIVQTAYQNTQKWNFDSFEDNGYMLKVQCDFPIL